MCTSRLSTSWTRTRSGRWSRLSGDDRLIFHLAIANPHWRSITDGTPALAVVTGPEGYVSPSWYAAKAEHGRVVPTWNYSAVHFSGHATVHRDPEWLRTAVGDLTDLHEGGRAEPWQVTDAPESFVAQELKAIVGVELAIVEVRAEAGERGAVLADEMQRDLD